MSKVKIVVSGKFKRSFRKFTRRNTKLQVKIEEVISKLSELDPKEFSQSAAIAIAKMEREKNGMTPSMSIWEIAIKVKKMFW
ncbi:MAG: hypothetical protein HC939_17450 [Pleurocapsa sp. SU_5_0]|nr:hypothetical protein [Pleurocapsa sp. SU_5_0]